MVTRAKKEKRERRRAGSSQRDAKHRVGGDWTSLSIPDGVELWQPKDKTYRIEIVPYVTGKGNPYAPPGLLYYERTYWTHVRVGVDNSVYVCPNKTAGKRCPICEHLAELKKDPDANKELIKDCRPRERQLWLIYDHGEEEKGVQLWDFSHHNFGKLLDKKRQRADDDEPEISDFDDPEAGAVLKVDFSEEKGGGYTYLVTDSIDFKPRKGGLSEDLLDHGICLDELLKVESYEKLRKVFLQIEDEDEEGEAPPRKPKPKSKPDPEPEDDEDAPWDDEDVAEGEQMDEDFRNTVQEDEEKPEKKRSKSKPKSKPKPKPEPEDDEDDEDEWDDDDEPEPEPKPKKGKGKPRKKSDPEPEDGGDDEDEWDDDDEEWDA